MPSFGQRMFLTNGEFFVGLTLINRLLIFWKTNLLLKIWWICHLLLFCKLQNKMIVCIPQPSTFSFPFSVLS
jgi:hypothetical protein